MKEFFKKRWVLLIVLVVFTIFKLPHLPVAYYWDESWPYAVAIKVMYHHGISLLPSAMDGNLSRGHPLFFHAMAATWMNIFGPSHISMHSFALLISLLFLISVYEAGFRIFNRRVAIISIILVAIQMVFFVQSSFVLFDMLVAFLGFVSIYFYVKGRYVLTALCLTMLFYTKESGLIFGFVLGMDALIGLFNSKDSLRLRISRAASIAVPCLLIGVFFIIQKQERGWYILPMYNDLVKHDWNDFWFAFRINPISTAFVMDYRYCDFLALLALSIVAAIKNRKAGYLILFFPGTIIYYFVDDTRAGRIMPSIPFFILFAISVFLMLVVLVKLKFFENKVQKKFLLLLCIFIFCYSCFSAMNFYTGRYMLAGVVPLLFFAAMLFDVMLTRTYKWLLWPVLIAVLSVSVYNFATNTDYGDCEVGAFKALDVQQHVVNYFEQNNDYDKQIGCNFLAYEHLRDPASGFLHSERSFKNVRWEMDNLTDFAIFDNIEGDYRYNGVKNDTSYRLVDRYENGRIWAEIYQRKK